MLMPLTITQEGMKPYFTLHETKDPTLPWQVRSNIRNENTGFCAPPDYYVAGFSSKDAALKYLESQ